MIDPTRDQSRGGPELRRPGGELIREKKFIAMKGLEKESGVAASTASLQKEGSPLQRRRHRPTTGLKEEPDNCTTST